MDMPLTVRTLFSCNARPAAPARLHVVIFIWRGGAAIVRHDRTAITHCCDTASQVDWHMQASCATSGDGLIEGLDWIAQRLQGDKAPPRRAMSQIGAG